MLVEEHSNPYRFLYRAVGAMRGLGIAGVTLGLMYLVPLLAAGLFDRFILLAIVPLAMGVAHLVLARQMKRRERWAIVGSVVLVSVEALLVVSWALAIVFSIGAIDLARGKKVGWVVMLAIVALVLLLLGRLIADLFASFEAIRLEPPPTGRRGFEPIPLARRADPLDDETSHGA